MKTYSPKASDVQRDWFVVDAEGLTLGRMATEIARILRGKHKPTFAPHFDMGDHVIVVNAEKIVLSSDKAEAKSRLLSLRALGSPPTPAVHDVQLGFGVGLFVLGPGVASL